MHLVKDYEKPRIGETSLVVYISAGDIGFYEAVEVFVVRQREPLADQPGELFDYLFRHDAGARGASREPLEVLLHREGGPIIYPDRLKRSYASLDRHVSQRQGAL